MCKIFASELGSKSRIMRGFQKGITLGDRTPVSVQKVYGGGWVGCGLLDFSVYLSSLRGEMSRTKSTRQVLDMFETYSET